LRPTEHDDVSLRWGALSVVAVAIAVYLPTLRLGFAYDDGIEIVRNPYVRSLSDLPKLLWSTVGIGFGAVLDNWRPLYFLSFALNYAATGLDPWSYHAVNVALHGLASGLVLLLAARLGVGLWGAAAGALLFAVHPIHVEAVANIAGRKDVLATVFVLAMLLAHLRARRGSGGHAALAVLACAAALLSKEMAIVGIALAAAHDLLLVPGDGSRPARVRTAALYAGLAVVIVVFLLLRHAKLAESPQTPYEWSENPVIGAPVAVRVMTAVAVFGKGIGDLLLPIGQSPDHSYAAIVPVSSALDPRFLAGLAVLVAWIGAGIALRRRTPLVLWSAGWYGTALLPASNLLFPIGTIYGERLLYLPSVGFCVLAGAAAATLARRIPRTIALAIGGVALAALAVLAVRYSICWKSDETLWREARRVEPRSAKAHAAVARYLWDAAPEEALAEIRQSLAIYDGSPVAHSIHGEILRKLGRTAEEERAFRRAIELSPSFGNAAFGLGRLARDAGRLDEAATWFQIAADAHPAHPTANADLAAFHLLRGELDAGERRARAAVALDPDQASAWYSLALVAQARGSRAAAREAYERFLATAGAEYEPEKRAVRAMLQQADRP
jgi:tetratricopeptide (TPR) repeat protein